MITIATDAIDSDTPRFAPRGTLLVTASTRPDIDALLDVCRRCWEPPASSSTFDRTRERWEPLRALYATLLMGRVEPHPDHLERSSWLDDVRGRFAGGGDGIAALILALAGLADAWREEDGETQRLQLAIASPAAITPDLEIDFRKPTAALVLRPGSLLAEFSVDAAVRSVGWLATVVTKVAKLAGPTVQAAADQLIEDARTDAKLKARFPLSRLDRLSKDERLALSQSPVVLVFLHGLFATDLGTFDGFIDRLQASNPLRLLSAIDSAKPATTAAVGGRAEALTEIRDRLQSEVKALATTNHVLYEEMLRGEHDEMMQSVVDSHIGLVGWPHNTLASIDANAGDLADLLERTFLPEPPRIIFVCHSRGGLVARAATVKLLELKERGSIWHDRLAGIVTFGTPHDGASITELPLRNLATYFLLATSTGKATSLLRVLSYLDARTAEGVEQLKREQASTKDIPVAFIEHLYSVERDVVRDRTGRRFPTTIAIGGVLDNTARKQWLRAAFSALATRWLTTDDHDLVVELRSTTSARLDADITAVVGCDHFNYFDTRGPEHDLAANLTLALVWLQLSFRDAFCIKLLPPIKYSTKGKSLGSA